MIVRRRQRGDGQPDDQRQEIALEDDPAQPAGRAEPGRPGLVDHPLQRVGLPLQPRPDAPLQHRHGQER